MENATGGNRTGEKKMESTDPLKSDAKKTAPKQMNEKS